MAEGAERNVPRNGNFGRAILEFANKWLKNKKGRKKGDKYYLETYLDGVKILFFEDCCVVKAKCYRSMRKTEAPHKLRIVFDGSEEEGIEVTTQCSCKAGTGKCQHLAALFTHVTVKLNDDDSPTSHLQQWHRPRGPSLEPQRWFASEFVKPRIDRKPHEVAPKTVQEYLYDPRPIEQRLMTERHVQQLGENISDVSPTTYASWLQYFNSASHQSLPWGNFLEGSPLANQLRDVYPPGFVATVYDEGLESVFEFPGEITLPEHVRKGSPLTVLDEEKLFLSNIMLSREKALEIEKNTRSQSTCSAWYQERSFRITASRFGEVVSRKAPINDRFLHSLFSSTKVQTDAMKYGLDMETTVVKDFKELSGPQVKVFKCGLLIHPDIYWMGCSPDGVIYDPNENPSVGILEIKRLFSMKGKSVEECLELKRDICIHRNQNGEIGLKHNHKYYFQLQGLMGISGLLWSKFCIHSKEGSENLFVQKIKFDPGAFHKITAKVHELYFSHCLPYLLRQ